MVPGTRVRVPFHGRTRIGYCVERTAESRHGEPLDIQAVLDKRPVLDGHLLELVQWTADYYLTSVGEVIEAALPSRVRREAGRRVQWVRLTEQDDAPEKGAGRAARERVLEVLRGADGPMPLAELAEQAGVSPGPVSTLARHGRVEIFAARPLDAPLTAAGLARATPPTLTDDQRNAFQAMRPALEQPHYQSFLLHGVTGSGKTEVYLRCIETALARKRGALVLVPEIALTSQTVARFESRLGRVAVLHSMLPDGERAAMHRRLAAGDVRVAIGARSAAFAPIRDLGVIIVDESHESTYKQEMNPRYHARDLAVLRASRLAVPCVLGTATPSLESLENARAGRYLRIRMPSRVTPHPLATVEIIDRRSELADRRGAVPLLSSRLTALLTETVTRGEQAILFLNRRGFARNIHCTRCGYALRCDACDIGLTYHKRVDRSMCHYCGAVRAVPRVCPDCGFTGIRRSHPGTERIEEVLCRLFPGTPVDRLDRDTATTRDRMEQILDRFRRGETRIMIGTQMVAKGHDIPGVTLVGVVDADIALSFPDFRAAEKTAQLICQVAGRAGRGDRPGRVAIQTHQPDHYAIEAGRRQDMEYLHAQEESSRRLLCYPPYGYLIRIVCEDHHEERAADSARELGKRLREAASPDVRVLGPAPAPMARLRGWYRYHILVKGRARRSLHSAVDPATRQPPSHSTTRVVVDVDPQSLS